MAQVDIVYGKLGHKGKLILYIMTRVLIFLVLLIAVKYGLYICKIKAIYKSAMLRAPGKLLYSAPIVGSFLVGYEVLTELVGVFCRELEPFEAGKKRVFRRHNEPETNTASGVE